MDAQKIIAFLFITALVTLTGCQTPRTGTPPWEPLPYTATPLPPTPTVGAFDREAEERAVYEALLQIPEDTTLAVRDTTASDAAFTSDADGYYDYLKKNTSGVSPELWADFVAVGTEQKPFPADLDSDGEYLVISKDELNAIFIDGNPEIAWDKFRTTYNAMAYSDYSRVGFSPDHTQALVYTGFHCGDLCGSGILVLLEKQAGQWHTVSQVMTWVS